jgi:hypothetical protein
MHFLTDVSLQRVQVNLIFTFLAHGNYGLKAEHRATHDRRRVYMSEQTENEEKERDKKRA